MVPTSYRVTETLRLSGRTRLFRAVRTSDGAHLLLKVLAPNARTPDDLARLMHELQIAHDLTTASLVRPVALDRLDGMPALLLDDPGCEPLERVMVGPMPLDRFLPIAVAAAAAVADVHGRGILHKELQPRSFMINERTGEVRITNFEVATVTPREEAARTPHPLDGSLAYVAPEQTGRVNRAVDQRSDLYSLGVMLYEMLTGQLPFTSDDPLQLALCHVARLPLPPSLLVATVPEMVSRIVMKLLAKGPEERYQSAIGLAEDLARCDEAWRRDREIAPFVLGRDDVSAIWHIPEELYGRAAQLAELAAAYTRVADGQRPELVLLAGEAGIGKTALARHFEAHVFEEHGQLVSGAFAPGGQGQPHAPMAQALSELTLDILSGSDAEIAQWRQRLTVALGRNAQLLTELIPRLSLIVGTPPPPPELSPAEAGVRFELTLRRFVATLTSRAHPVVVFLDDLQRADAASLALVQELLAANEVRHLLVVGAFRSDDVGDDHPLRRAMAALRRRGVPVRELPLEPLETKELAALLAATVRQPPLAVAPLAALLRQKTGGNPLFAIRFLTALHRDQLITFDPGAHAWRWDLEAIRTQGPTDNLAGLMLTQLQRLAPAARTLVTLAACAGRYVDLPTLAVLSSRDVADIEHDLVEPVAEGLLIRIGADSYRFAHDRVWQAAYRLLPEDARIRAHLAIARHLRAQPAAAPERLFAIADQFAHGAPLITDAAERLDVAALALSAGQKARAANAYSSAEGYFELALGLLGPDAFRDHHELAWAIERERAICALVAGNGDAADERLRVLTEHAVSDLEKAGAYRWRQQLYLNRGQIEAAVESTHACLAMLGVELPHAPDWDAVQAERERVRRLIGDRPIERLVDLPPLTDARTQAVLTLDAPSVFVDQKMYFIHVARMLAVSIEHGNCDASIIWYGCYGVALGGLFGAHAEGYRFARVASELAARRQAEAYRARGAYFVASTGFWTQPLAEALAEARTGLELGIETGDLMTASYSIAIYISGRLVQGEPLPQLAREVDECLAVIRERHVRDVEDCLTIVRQLVRDLQGHTCALASFADDEFDPEAFAAGLDETRMANIGNLYAAARMLAFAIAGDWTAARAVGDATAARMAMSSIVPWYRDLRFYHALALAATADDGDDDARATSLERLAEAHRELSAWAATNPETFGHAAALIAAERARLEHRDEDAARHYEAAIAGARAGGFGHDEPLAYERAAQFWAARGFASFALLYLGEARAGYARWGAVAKVRQLDARNADLAARGDLVGSGGAPGSGSLQEQLDVMSVLEASRAISREVQLGPLVRALLEIALAQSGAERGCLLLPRGGELWIEAEASAGASAVGVVTSAPLPATQARTLPLAIVQLVWRTGERVILDDAGEANRFGDDAYLVARRPRSLLCLPIKTQARLVGLLYLENNRLAGAFVPQRLTVLGLLAAQAAISLENARFVADQQAARAEAEASRWRAAFVAEASAVFGDCLDEDVVLQRLAALVVGGVGDWCAIDLLDGSEPRRVAGAHIDPARRPLVMQARGLGSRMPLLVSALSDDELRRLCADDTQAEALVQLGTRSVMLVPLSARGQTLGALLIASAEPGRYGTDDLQMAEEVARRAAMAVDNARLYHAAREAIQLRDEFLSVASHELYTPMTSLRLSVQVLQRFGEHVSPDKLIELCHRIARQAERMRKLIDDLMNVSRIEAGRLMLQPTSVDLAALTHEVVDRFQYDLAQAGCTVEVRAPGAVVGSWDRSQLDQVVTNLVANAIKFGPGGPIEVAVGQEGNVAQLRVRDHGIGIDPTRQKRIFERFERAVSAKSYGGMGLGLYITRRIVEAHGGAIAVDSALGSGTTFVVELPCRRADASDAISRGDGALPFH